MWLAVMRQSSSGGESEAELFYQKSIKADPTQRAGPAQLRRACCAARSGSTKREQMEDARAQPARTAERVRPIGTGVYRVGGGVTAPALLFKTEPEYSAEGARGEVPGNGPAVRRRSIRTARRRISRCGAAWAWGSTNKSIEAVKRWQFKPGTKDGMPVTGRGDHRSELAADVKRLLTRAARIRAATVRAWVSSACICVHLRLDSVSSGLCKRKMAADGRRCTQITRRISIPVQNVSTGSGCTTAG